MENLDLKQLTSMISILAEEKGLSKDDVLEILEAAIAAAWRKDNGDKEMSVRASLNLETGAADIYVGRIVVEEGVAYNPSTEIPLEKAPEGSKIGDVVEEKFKMGSFGYVAAMTAKQVVAQKLREAESNAVLHEFEDKIGTIVVGTVVKVDSRIVKIDLGRATGIMPRGEQIEGERYSVGARIKAVLKDVARGDRGTQLILSRGCEKFIECLFQQEVPEIENGTVEIKGIAREAGRRTKIAVASTVPGIDPVGTFVGGRGVRVQAVMNEIGNREKIDIINWSDNLSEYIIDALAPAEILKVEIDGQNAKVFVTEDQQSIAIGKQGQNVRLASKLTNCEIDIEVSKAAPKKKKQNVEDSLLSAIEETTEEE